MPLPPAAHDQSPADWSQFTAATASDQTTEVYEFLLADSEPSRDQLVAANFPEDVIEEALTSLAWRGLIDIADDGSVTLRPPELVMPAYAAALEHWARAARTETPAFTRLYHARRGSAVHDSVTGLIRPLTSIDEVTDVAVALERSISTSMHVLLAGGERVDLLVQGLHAPVPSTEDATVERVAVIESTTLSAEGAATDLQARQAIGYDIRIATHLPFNALIVDRQIAVIDTSNAVPDAAGSLLIQDPILVRTLLHLVERIYDQAMPLPSKNKARGMAIQDRDRVMLTMMAAGATDATIARALHVSTRTVERRIKAIMDLLEVSTRFQAGVQAVRAGLFMPR